LAVGPVVPASANVRFSLKNKANPVSQVALPALTPAQTSIGVVETPSLTSSLVEAGVIPKTLPGAISAEAVGGVQERGVVPEAVDRSGPEAARFGFRRSLKRLFLPGRAGANAADESPQEKASEASASASGQLGDAARLEQKAARAFDGSGNSGPEANSDAGLRPVRSRGVLRLESPDGKRVELEASDFLTGADSKPRAYVRDFVRTFLSRNPAENGRVFRRIGDEHGRHEMNFMVKNKATGAYDEVFVVPFRGYIPLPEKQMKRMAESTGPFMREFRALLQKVYSNREHTAESLGLAHLPEKAKETLLRVIRESIYLEKRLIHPVMADYPFAPVIGFDFAIDDPESPSPVAYEANGATPSGLSNNIQLKELFRKLDPELYSKIESRLSKGNPFKALKKVVDASAEHWTGVEDGISVVLGPGSDNGAHPDVASIAEYSGMPLVEPRDLYIDAGGAVRLNTGRLADDPRVTGIYSRVDESYLFENPRSGVAIRHPSSYAKINKRLSKKLGIELDPHTGYEYIRDRKGRVVGVERDEEGRPKHQRTLFRFGRDPARENGETRMTLLDAVLAKKIFVSNIGGRTLDDKRAFQIVSQHLAGPNLAANREVVGPTRTLEPEEYEDFYRASDRELDRFVVKEPDESGGQGIFIMVNLDRAEKARVVGLVRKDPTRYTIQEFARQTLVTTVGRGGDGREIYETTAMDMRYYAMLDPEGKVVFDPDAVLGRVAEPKSGSTNTSQGAGYGLVLAVKDAAAAAARRMSALPRAPKRDHLGEVQDGRLKAFARQLNFLFDLSRPDNPNVALGSYVESLLSMHRKLMSVLGRGFSPFMTELRPYVDGRMSEADLHRITGRFIARLRGRAIRAPRGQRTVRRELKGYYRGYIRPVDVYGFEDLDRFVKTKAIRSENRREFTYEGETYVQREVMAVLSARERYAAPIVEAVRAAGGQVRQLAVTRKGGRRRLERIPAFNYFRFTDDHYPVIAVDLRQPYAAASLAHEFEHFKDWVRARDGYRAMGAGEKEARRRAREDVLETRFRVGSEQRAVEAELKMELEEPSEFNRSRGIFADQLWQRGFIPRVLYPQIEGVRDLLHGARYSGKELDVDLLEDLIAESIATAKELRTMARRKHRADMKKVLSAGGAQDDPRIRYAELQLERLQALSLFELIFTPLEQTKFADQGLLDDLKASFEVVAKRRGGGSRSRAALVAIQQQ
jgi:uncharacterized circularly permuted ATP-grasp superfamily protein